MKKITAILICILILSSCEPARKEISDTPTPSNKPTQEKASGPTEDIKTEYTLSNLNTHYIRHSPSDIKYDEYPIITQINSIDELYTFYEDYKYRKGLITSSISSGFIYEIKKYDAKFFYKNSVIILEIIEGSGSIRHEVTGANVIDNNIELKVKRLSPEVLTADMANWLILVDIPSKAIYDEIDIAMTNEEITYERYDYITPTVISDDSIIEVYDHRKYSKTYDTETGKKTVEENAGLNIKDIANSLDCLEIGSDLALKNFSYNILNAAIYDNSYNMIEFNDNFSFAQLLKQGAGTYYIKIDYFDYGIYNYVAEENEYYEGEYFFKLNLDDKKYGLDKSLFEICSLDTANITNANFNIDIDGEMTQDISLLNDIESIINLLIYLRASNAIASLGSECEVDNSREIILGTVGGIDYSIMQTSEGILFETDGAKYYLITPPWCYDFMVSSVVGQTMISANDAIALAKEDIAQRDYPISFDYDYEINTKLTSTDWGYKWEVIFTIPDESGVDKIVEVGLTTNGHITSVRTSFD